MRHPGSGLGAHRRSFFGLCRRLSFRCKLLPIAAFLDASMHGPNLRLLLHDKRRPALRARLRHRHMRRCKIAIWISRAPVEDSGPSPPTLARAPAPHKLTFAALRALDPHGDRPRVLALWIAGTPNEFPKAPVLLDQMIPAQRAFFFQRLVRLVRNPCTFHQPTRGLAIRIPAARQKRSKPPALQ